MSVLRMTALGAALAATFVAAPASAYEAGDFVARAGWARVMPNVDSDQVGAIAGSKVDVDNSNSLGLTFTYMFTDNIGLGVLASWPFNIDVSGDGSISSLGKIGEAKALPPTITAQYHFDTGSAVHPYIGAGFNYTWFFSEDAKGSTVTDFDLDNSFGLAGEAGVDFDVSDDWLVSAQVWYIKLDTTGKTNVGKVDVDVDPWAFMLGVGKKF